MSMSTGDVRRPNSKLATKAAASDQPEAEEVDTTPKGGVLPTKKATKAPTRASASKAQAGATKARPAGKSAPRPTGGGKGRKPIAPVKVSQGRNWGPIAMFTAAGVAAVAIIGIGAYPVIKEATQPSWQERAAAISGISNYLETNQDWFTYDSTIGNHQAGSLTYPVYPPVGGTHNPRWQNCMGDVYTAEIPKEQAVHSLEHGAVWVTYNPDLPQDQVEALADRVRDVEFMMMSPYPGLDKPISLQAWGYQLKVDNASDGRIDEFINALRKNATQEPQAGCSGGYTDPGSVPLDLPGS